MELFFSLLLYGMLTLLTWIAAKSRNALFWSDAYGPIFIVLFWIMVTYTGYGQQSLSHIIEVPIALVLNLIVINIRVFIVDKIYYDHRKNSLITLGLSLFIVFLLRTFMPFLPE
ncbi:hypothetical protein [Moritella sp. 24]|uniref:hypothetical protein n=1 Tax=Moritella sp. 24 TaxID=2746230 RepID=UPI002104BE20|nr:hypothetical protein [Moritella sp. 24]